MKQSMKETARRLQELLEITVAPVAISFLDRAPAGVPRLERAGAASCSYWSMAAEGRVFHTVAADHFNCPVGAFTHGVDLPEAQRGELNETLKMMIGLDYVTMDEVNALPRRMDAFGVAVYAPLAAAPCDPDIVLLRGNARQMMLLAEAAQRAGLSGAVPAMGRPTCVVLPQAIDSGKTAMSLGCVGNRVYTGAADGEAYIGVPGAVIDRLLHSLESIVRANQELESYHRDRRARLEGAKA